VEFACALFPVNLVLSQNNNISLRGLRKSAGDAHARLSVHGAVLDIKDINHRLNSEHECKLVRLPLTMAVHGYRSLRIRATLSSRSPLRPSMQHQRTSAIMSFICASVINHDITKVMGH
jgi:hypothetical protein